MKLFTFIFLGLVSIISAADIFQLSLDHLNSIASSGETEIFQEVFKEAGAFVVNSLPTDYTDAVRGLKRKGPNCLDSQKAPVFDLPDGSKRQTFALVSETITEYPACIKKEAEVIHQHFEDLDTSLSAIILGTIGDSRRAKWTTDNIRGNILDKIYKEHIHVYTNKESTGLQDYAVPFHTDNGLMLFLTPYPEHPLKIRNSLGEDLDLSHIEDDSIIVILGSALPNWLLQGQRESSRFVPGLHAVPSLTLDVDSRTVFARMKVAPANAKSLVNPAKSFGEYFSEEGSGSSWSGLLSSQCGEGEAYCWMSCLSLPPNCTEEQAVCVNLEDEPCCTETVTDGCINMDGFCHWECSSSSLFNRT